MRGRAAPLIDPWPYVGTIDVRSYDILADGSFVAVVGLVRRNQFRVTELHVVLNFFEDLKGRAGK